MEKLRSTLENDSTAKLVRPLSKYSPVKYKQGKNKISEVINPDIILFIFHQFNSLFKSLSRIFTNKKARLIYSPQLLSNQ